MNQTELKLSVIESGALTKLMNTSPSPYIRERACALLHVSRGISCLEVGYSHLLKKRERHTVSEWVRRYKEQGISGLTHKAGKGRHPSFSPLSKEQAQEAALLVIRRSPAHFGLKNSRWTLKMLLLALKTWLKVSTQYGVWRALKSLKINHKRTANHVHSPDAAYDAKLAHIIEQIGKYSPYSLDGKRPCIVLFTDECTVYSKATQSYDWELSTQEPKAELGLNYSQSFRIAATLDIWTGKVISTIRQKLTIASLIAFYKSICEAYPDCDILLIQDNWPVHYHPDIRAALLPQKMPFEVKLPKSWEVVQAANKYKKLNLPIYTISLPTYASWLNPIEKLWRILKQDLLHKHPFTDNFNELKIKTQEYLNTFIEHSLYLLNYVGLFNADSILGKPTLNIFKNWGLPRQWTDEYF